MLLFDPLLEVDLSIRLNRCACLLKLRVSEKKNISYGHYFLLIGGGLGIPYHTDDAPLKMVDMATIITDELKRFKEKHGYEPRLLLEIGRSMACPRGHSMGFNYNGRLRPKELLLRTGGTVELIRRQETVADLFATLNFEPDICIP